MRFSKKRETLNAVQAQGEKKTALERGKKAVRCAYALGMAASTFATAAAATGAVAYAAGKEQQVITQIKNIMTSVMKYVGIGLCIFGVYELAMAFLQQAPEQKTKGILIIVVGALMTGMGGFIDSMAAE